MPFLRNPSASAITAASLAKTSRRLLGSSSSSQLTTATNTRTRTRTTTLSRYGLGGQHWRQFNPESYQELIYQSLSKQVSHFEVAGQEGGDIAMTGAIHSALERNPDFLSSPVTITARLGYRSLIGNAGAGTHTANEDEQAATAAATPSENQPMLGDVILAQPPEEGKNGTSNRVAAYDTPGNVVHNISSDYLLQTVRSSPLLELRDIMENLRLVFLLHNPEVQVVDLLQEDPRATPEAQQEFIRQRWTPAMETLQEYSCNNNSSGTSNGVSVSFGICSNGLGIPKADNHPMHLDTDSVVQAAKTYDRFSTIQLPANLLETYGWEMARKIKAETQLDVVAMRPLTCYPDLGTGSGYPFRLVDYSLPTLQDDNDDDDDDSDGANNNSGDGIGTEAAGTSSLRYTNEITGIPTIYQMTLQAAMSHFDAEELLELKQERELTMEERETLDGCKLMQSMIHDLDNQLPDIRSFAAHEDELYGRIIPLIHNTFELMDDTTSDVLQVSAVRTLHTSY